MSLKDEILAKGWSDDGTDTEWDEETKKDWEEKMNSVPKTYTVTSPNGDTREEMIN